MHKSVTFDIRGLWDTERCTSTLISISFSTCKKLAGHQHENSAVHFITWILFYWRYCKTWTVETTWVHLCCWRHLDVALRQKRSLSSNVSAVAGCRALKCRSTDCEFGFKTNPYTGCQISCRCNTNPCFVSDHYSGYSYLVLTSLKRDNCIFRHCYYVCYLDNDRSCDKYAGCCRRRCVRWERSARSSRGTVRLVSSCVRLSIGRKPAASVSRRGRYSFTAVDTMKFSHIYIYT